jgi:hypothetical protein
VPLASSPGIPADCHLDAIRFPSSLPCQHPNLPIKDISSKSVPDHSAVHSTPMPILRSRRRDVGGGAPRCAELRHGPHGFMICLRCLQAHSHAHASAHTPQMPAAHMKVRTRAHTRNAHTHIQIDACSRVNACVACVCERHAGA